MTPSEQFAQERLDKISARLQPLVRRLADATVPLCQSTERRRVTPAGSGVLLQIEERRYLLTASHVFEHAVVGRPIVAIAGERFVSLASAPRWRTKPLPGGVDRADLAVVELGQGRTDAWHGVSFLGLADIDPFGPDLEAAPATAFMALGYPRSKQPKVLRDGSYAAFLYHFVTHLEPIPPDSAVGADPSLHLVIGYDRQDFVGTPGVTKMPDPDGMSGGGLWRIPGALTSERPVGHLVGILTGHHARPRLILASRIGEVLRFLVGLNASNATVIARRFPGLDAPAT